MRNIVIISLVLLGLCSCRAPDTIGFSQPILFNVDIPDGPPEYKAGWYDGCKSALSSKGFANSWVYQENKGPEFGSGVYHHDPVYQTAWGQAWFACVLTTNQFSERSAMQFAPLD